MARQSAPAAHFFCLVAQARGLADALLGKYNGVQRGSGNAPTLATPQEARFRGAAGRLDSLGKGFLERGGSATKWYHSPAPLRGGPAGQSAGELVNNPEERDGLRDLPAGPGQPVQMPGMRGRALFSLYEGAPEESLLAGQAITSRRPAAGQQGGRGPPAQSLGGINPGLPFTGIYRERLKPPAGPALGRQPPVFPCRALSPTPSVFKGRISPLRTMAFGPAPLKLTKSPE